MSLHSNRGIQSDTLPISTNRRILFMNTCSEVNDLWNNIHMISISLDCIPHNVRVIGGSLGRDTEFVRWRCRNWREWRFIELDDKHPPICCRRHSLPVECCVSQKLITQVSCQNSSRNAIDSTRDIYLKTWRLAEIRVVKPTNIHPKSLNDNLVYTQSPQPEYKNPRLISFGLWFHDSFKGGIRYNIWSSWTPIGRIPRLSVHWALKTPLPGNRSHQPFQES